MNRNFVCEKLQKQPLILIITLSHGRIVSYIMCVSLLAESLQFVAYPNDSLDVTVTLGKIFRAEFRGSFTVLNVSLEDSSGTFTLGTNHTSHLVFVL